MSEFDIYKRIIEGDLRPHLKANSSPEKIEKEFYSLEFTNTGNPDDFLKNIEKLTTEFHGIQKGDEIRIELPESDEPPKITIQKVQNDSEEELINLDIPPAPDEKSDIYLRLIEDEYCRIKSSLVKNLGIPTALGVLKKRIRFGHFVLKAYGTKNQRGDVSHHIRVGIEY